MTSTSQHQPVEYFYLLNVTWQTPTGYINGFSRGGVVLPPTVTTRLGAMQWLLAELGPANEWPHEAQVTAFTLEPNQL